MKQEKNAFPGFLFWWLETWFIHSRNRSPYTHPALLFAPA
jgi:hypothetical protein